MLEPTRVYHEVRLATGGSSATYQSGDKETVSLTYATEWRGRPVTVVMEADRYVHSSGWSEWRAYARSARESVEIGLGADLTDLARSRLSDQLRPDVFAWLESAAYAPSESAAYVAAIRREMGDMRGSYSVDRVRTALHVNADKIGPDAIARFERALAAYEQYVAACEEI